MSGRPKVSAAEAKRESTSGPERPKASTDSERHRREINFILNESTHSLPWRQGRRVAGRLPHERARTYVQRDERDEPAYGSSLVLAAGRVPRAQRLSRRVAAGGNHATPRPAGQGGPDSRPGRIARRAAASRMQRMVGRVLR